MVKNLASVALFSKFCCNAITTKSSHPVDAGTQSNNIGVSLKHSIMERDRRTNSYPALFLFIAGFACQRLLNLIHSFEKSGLRFSMNARKYSLAAGSRNIRAHELRSSAICAFT